MRCKSGLVVDKGAPVKTTQFFDMGKANPNFRDSQGRAWPGGCWLVLLYRQRHVPVSPDKAEAC